MTNKVSKESLALGGLLWKRTKRVYEIETQKAREHSYPFTERRQVLSKEAEGSGPPVLINVYSDGAGLGNNKSKTGKGITGYGYGFIAFREGKVFHNSVLRSGTNKFHSTAEEAEARGCLKGIQHAKAAIKKSHKGPINIDISMDNLGVITALHNIPKVLEEIKTIEATPRAQWSNYITSKHKELKLVLDIANEIYNDPRVTSVTTTWVKSHIFDSTRIEDMKHIQNYFNHQISTAPSEARLTELKRERLLFQALRNNKLVDKEALKGAFRSLTKRVDFLASRDYSGDGPKSQALAIAGTLKNSMVARQTVIGYLATKEKEYIPEQYVKVLLGDSGPAEINNKVNEYANRMGCPREEVPSRYLKEMQKGKEFFTDRIDDYISKKEKPIHYRFGQQEKVRGASAPSP